MADLDADLLALAGDGDSSDGEEVSEPLQPKEDQRQASEAPARSETPQSARAESPATKREPDGVSKTSTARKRGAAKAPNGIRPVKKARRRDDSEEEGEASSSSSRPSLQPALSESEAESEADGMESQDVSSYPLEGKFSSEADKAHILSLPEIKREEILAERATVVERDQQRRMLTQLLKDKERKENKSAEKKKRKAGSTDPEESSRKSSRQKTTLGGRKVGESSAPLEAYKKQREQRGLHNEQRRLDDYSRSAEKNKKDDDDSSDADADGESEVEWDEGGARKRGKGSPSPSGDNPPPSLKEINRAKVGRIGFAKVCFYPGFEESITGCFVRISLGPDRATGRDVYRLAKIKGFSEGRPYALEGANGKKFVCKQYLHAAHGKAEKDWPFIFCSESPVTEAEFERYMKTCEFEGVATPTRRGVDVKVDDINKLLNRSWTEDEIQEKLRRSGALQNKVIGLERTAIQKKRQDAVALGDEALIAKYDAELQALAPPKLAFGTTLSSSSPSQQPQGLSQQERLAILNKNNRKANAIEVRKAQIAEKRQEAINQAAVARGEAVANPFARVKTRAKVMHDVNADRLAPPKSRQTQDGSASDTSRAGTPMSIGRGATPTRKNTPSMPVSKKRDVIGFHKKPTDDEIIASFDLGIDDIDI